jgi:hypothetical protein
MTPDAARFRIIGPGGSKNNPHKCAEELAGGYGFTLGPKVSPKKSPGFQRGL